jgi:hypothetical protein
MTLYLLEAEFSAYDEFSSLTVGIFDSLELVQYHENKWRIFYTTKKEEIFSKYKSDTYRDVDGDLLEEYENEFYTTEGKFSDIFNFQSMCIKTYELNSYHNENVFGNPKKSFGVSDEYAELIKQWNLEWDRDHKINEILK